MGDVAGGERQVTSRVWRQVTVAGVLVAAAGAAAAVVAVVVRGAGAPWLATAALVVTVGAALSVLGLWAPRSVHADASGLTVRRGLPDRVVPWADVRRVRGNGQGMAQTDTHLELVGGDLVELPGRVGLGTVERWRRETGGAPPAPESGDRRTWPLLRPTAYLPAFLYLPLLLNVFLDGWALLLAVLAGLVATVVLHRRPRPQVVATPAGFSVPTWRGRRQVAWDDLVQVRGRSDRWDVLSAAETRDGRTVDLPAGLTPDLVEQWRADLHGAGRP